MPVSSLKPMYLDLCPKWELVRAVMNSDLCHKRYIPDIDSDDQYRCKKHRQRAVLVNFTKRTNDGLTGAAFRNQYELTVPASMAYIETDTTGNKLRIEQTAKRCISEIFTVGRIGILVDYPSTPLELDQYSAEVVDPKARMYLYTTESIINWATNDAGGSEEIVLVVLQEEKELLADDGFAWTCEKQYRVLRINDAGNYQQELYDKDLKLIGAFEPMANGKKMKTLPFGIAGASTNDINDKNLPPLYDLAVLNIAHYNNSADFEEAAHLSGQATLFFTSSRNQTATEEKLQKQPIRLGSGKGVYLGTAGDAKLLQSAETSMNSVGMQMKEQQAIMLGAKLIVPSAANETATTTLMNKASEISVLEMVVGNVEDAMNLALQQIAEFMGATNSEIEFRLSHDFIPQGVDPQVLVAMMQGLGTVVGPQAVRQYWRDVGLIPESMTDEELEQDIVSTTDPMTDSLLFPEQPNNNDGQQ